MSADTAKYEVLCRHREVCEGAFSLHPTAVISRNCRIDTTGGVTIGPRVCLCEEVAVYTHEHDPADHQNTAKIRHSPITIQEGAFVGARSIILESVREIGAGSVICAGSVVTRDVPAGVRVGGNPAREIKAQPVQT